MNTNNIIFVVLVVSIFFNIVPALSTASTSNDECLGWYNHNRVDFLVRGGVLPGTILTCDQDELDRLNQLAAINEHEGEAVTPQPDSDDDDDEEDRKDIRYCANSGYWNGHKCVINDEVEQAAYEDAVCDDPKDTQKYTSICGGSSNNEDNQKRMTTERRDPNSGLSQEPIDYAYIVDDEKKMNEAIAAADQKQAQEESDRQKYGQEPNPDRIPIPEVPQQQDDDDDDEQDDTPKSDNDNGDNTAKDDSGDTGSSSNDNNDNSSDDSDSGDSKESDNKDSKDSGN